MFWCRINNEFTCNNNKKTSSIAYVSKFYCSSTLLVYYKTDWNISLFTQHTHRVRCNIQLLHLNVAVGTMSISIILKHQSPICVLSIGLHALELMLPYSAHSKRFTSNFSIIDCLYSTSSQYIFVRRLIWLPCG